MKKPDYPFVCAETAVKLRDIGMAQPAKAHGQMWYVKDSLDEWIPSVFFANTQRPGWQSLKNIVDFSADDEKYLPDDLAYAPTADYILRLFGPDYSLSRDETDSRWHIRYKNKVCLTGSDHPAEAAALAYRNEKEKLKELSGDIHDVFFPKTVHENFPRPTLDDIQRNLGKEFTTKRIALLDTGEFVKYHVSDARKNPKMFEEEYVLIGAGWPYSYEGMVDKSDKPYMYFFRRKATRPEDVE